jgi:hypothetical protein
MAGTSGARTHDVADAKRERYCWKVGLRNCNMKVSKCLQILLLSWPDLIHSIPLRVARCIRIRRCFERDRKKETPCQLSQWVWHDKDPSLLKSLERRESA